MFQPKGQAPCLRFGLAGEYRVMSELLLRGLTPSKVILDDGGIDIVLTNKKTIQVKTAKKLWSNKRGYKFSADRYKNGLQADFYIFWLFDDDIFLVVPKEEMNKNGYMNILTEYTGGYSYPRTKFLKFKDAWNLLG